MSVIMEDGIMPLGTQVDNTPRRSTRISRSFKPVGPSPYVPDVVRRSRSRSRSSKNVLYERKEDNVGIDSSRTKCNKKKRMNKYQKDSQITIKNELQVIEIDSKEVAEVNKIVSQEIAEVNEIDSQEIAEVNEIDSNKEKKDIANNSKKEDNIKTGSMKENDENQIESKVVLSMDENTPIEVIDILSDDENSILFTCVNVIPATPNIQNADNSFTENISTPISKPYRTNLTPYKSMQQTDLIIDDINDISIDVVNNKMMSTVGLKSIRKRSMSLSERPKTKYRVTFNSPSNSAIVIDRIDEIMRSSAKKTNKLENITNRRKRSFSLSEIGNTSLAINHLKGSKLFAESEEHGVSFLPKPTKENPKSIKSLVEDTPKRLKRLPVPTSRTKLPNFAAIHQNNFKKMESIDDHLTRKAERAKILTSASKTKVPIQNSTSKTNLLKEPNKTHVETRIPRARQKIDLSDITWLPKPKTNESLSISLIGGSKKVLSSSKSKLNTSTVVAFGTSVPCIESTSLSENKFMQRQKRIADLYKGRNFDKKEDGIKKREIIRGVRSNRRFELQMQSRNQRMK